MLDCVRVQNSLIVSECRTLSKAHTGGAFLVDCLPTTLYLQLCMNQGVQGKCITNKQHQPEQHLFQRKKELGLEPTTLCLLDRVLFLLSYQGSSAGRSASLQHNTTQHNTTQHNTTQHNTTQHNTTQHNTTQHNTTQHNTTQHNTTQGKGKPQITLCMMTQKAVT